LKVIRIGGPTAELNESAGLAKKLGYLDEELNNVGYKAEYYGFIQAGPAINEALAASSLDVAIAADFPQLVALNNGIKIRAFAPITRTSHYGIAVQESSNIQTVKDLEGKNIIVGKGTILQKVFNDFLIDGGADPDKVNLVNAQADAQSVFASGEADGIISATSLILSLKGSANAHIVATTWDKPEFASTQNFVGRSEYLDANPEATKAIVRALIRAYEFAASNPEKAYENLATELIPAQFIASIYAFDPKFDSFYPEYDSGAKERISNVNKFLVNNGLITDEIDLNVFIDSSYFEAVKGKDV
jgi:sulfonate transport system substrate-binding protein